MSVGGTTTEATREALVEIQRYLADEIAPLMAVDAARALLRMPTEHGALVIERWLEAQLSAPDRAVSVSSYLFHAVKKFHAFSELKLIDPAALNHYVAQLSRLVVRMCPEVEQTELRLRLSRIGESETRLSAPVRLLNRELGSEEEEEQIQKILEEQKQVAEEAKPDAQGPQVLLSPGVTMLTERLEALRANPQADGEDGRGEQTEQVVADLVSRAAIDAGNSAQFESSLTKVSQMGIEPKLDEVFRQLGRRLPGWDTDLKLAAGDQQPPLGHLLRAMHRIVALADTTEEGAERFSGMVYAAIEQLNDGHLAQAVAMFDVAQRLMDDGKVDAHLSGIVRSRAEGSISLGALRKFASVPAKHGLLRRVLRFFGALSPSSLLERLDGEKKREVRKLMLSLLEVHGTPCRPTLLERLSRYLAGTLPDPGAYYSRNVVFLLRRIPRGSDDDVDQEIQLLEAYSRPDQPFMVTKEAVGALALLGVPKAERVLAKSLAAFEFETIEGSLPYSEEETLEILDRTCAALARLGTPGAVRAVVTHGFRKEPQLGDVLRRVKHLGVCDLGKNPDQLRVLVEGLRKLLPARLLGLTLGRRIHEVSHLVRALCGTAAPEVQALFEEIVQRFPDKEFGELAREALNRFGSTSSPEEEKPQALTGDLELFELPNLLQSMADSKLTGRLVLTNTNGRDRAVLLLGGGKIHHCETGRLRGLDAACHLFERPQPGTFRFERTAAEQIQSEDGTVLDVVSTILEAMRRHDEFQQDRALVPDGSSLMPGQQPPALPDTEKDLVFARNVWREASRGTAPESCEGIVGDAYRVRRLFKHWLEIGALTLRPAM